jgi:mannose-6-phosphate isomerase
MFEPMYVPKIWGGRRIGELFSQKRLPDGVAIGESWEVCDLETDQSVVACGPAKGRTLEALVREWGADLIGGGTLFEGRFPLFIKYLDAVQTLSVQVHPDAATAKRLGGNVRMKNEAWYVLRADGDAAIYRGLRKGVTRKSFEAAIAAGTVEETLNRIPVREGDCHYLPSGTVHALGAGVVVAEVQTPSDITYRVFDWNRVDETTGQPRDLHVAEALDCIDFDNATPAEQRRSHVASYWTTVTQLVSCESFKIEKVRMVEGMEMEIPYAELVVWMVLSGSGSVGWKGASEPMAFQAGDVVALPAALQAGVIKTDVDTTWLEVTLPVESDLAGFDRPDRRSLQVPDGSAMAPLPVSISAKPKKKSS